MEEYDKTHNAYLLQSAWDLPCKSAYAAEVFKYKRLTVHAQRIEVGFSDEHGEMFLGTNRNILSAHAHSR